VADITSGKIDTWVWEDSPDWSTHANGNNFLAIISEDDTAPGGFKREFVPRAKGKRGFVTRTVTAGDAIEVGSYTLGKNGALTKNRHYYVVLVSEKNKLELQKFLTPGAAILGAGEERQEQIKESPIDILIRRKRDIILGIKQLQTELSEIDLRIGNHIHSVIDPMTLTDEATVAMTKEVTDQLTPAEPEAVTTRIPAGQALPEVVKQVLAPTKPQVDDWDEELSDAEKRALGLPV